jgi:hypothetical protein
MPTTSTKHLTKLLNSLSTRARRPGDKPDLSPAIPLVNDLGRLIVKGKASDIRSAQAAVAGVREQLEYGEVANTPYKALTGLNSHAYLAGAMWVVNEVMNVRLDTMSLPAPKGRVTRKSRIKNLVLSGMTSGGAVTPSSLLEAVSDDGDVTPRLDEVSRALGELLTDELVKPVDPEPGTDRRTKYFTLTDEGRTVAQERLGAHGATNMKT